MSATDTSVQRFTGKRRVVTVLLAFVPLLAAACILFLFDPLKADFYPTCAFKKLTGWSCPACGCLRATHQLLHGHIATAFRLNALYIVLLPFIVWTGIQELRGRPWFRNKGAVGWTLLAVLILFGILRNLPPFLAWSAR
jgi:hypothetical protein